MKNAIILFFVYLIISCQKKEIEKIEVVELVPSNSISQLDTLFFTNVTIFSDEEHVYFLSHSPAFLATTDKKLNLLKVSADRGAGPNEFSFPTQGMAYGGFVYVVDQGNQSIKRFDADEGKFLSSTKIPEQIFDFKIGVDEQENVYYPIFSPFDENVILKVNKEGKQIDRFKSSFPDNSRIGENRQVKHFQRDEKGNFIIVGASLPYVELLNASGESINTFNIGDVEPIRLAIDSLEYDLIRNPVSKSNIPMVILGVQYDKGKLYMTFVDRVGYDRSRARNLLVFNIDETKCQLEKIYKFNTGNEDDGYHPSNFHVDSDAGKLYTQGLSSKQIFVFDLPD